MIRGGFGAKIWGRNFAVREQLMQMPRGGTQAENVKSKEAQYNWIGEAQGGWDRKGREG